MRTFNRAVPHHRQYIIRI